MTRLAQLAGRLASAPSRLKVAPKVAMPFYQSPAWRALVAAVIKARGRRCEDCGAQGVRVFADHVVELKDGGAALDARNLRLRCGSCHGRKTEQRKRERIGLA